MSVIYVCRYPTGHGYTTIKSIADKVQALMTKADDSGYHQMVFTGKEEDVKNQFGGWITKGLMEHIQAYEAAGLESLNNDGARDGHKG